MAAFHPKRPLPATIIPSVASRSDAKNHYVRWRRAAVVNVCLGGSSSIVWDGLQGTFKYFDSSNETREERNARNMKRMAEQRLKTTVNHLERDLRRQTAETRRMTKFVGSHVIVDASVLLGQFTLVKRLVASRQVFVRLYVIERSWLFFVHLKESKRLPQRIIFNWREGMEKLTGAEAAEARACASIDSL